MSIPRKFTHKGFKRKSYDQIVAAKRKFASGKSKRIKTRDQWQHRLSQQWQQTPITYCECRFNGCFGTYGLAPAHSKDRGDIHTEADFAEVVAACEHCHRILDHKMSKEDRLKVVKGIITQREIC